MIDTARLGRCYELAGQHVTGNPGSVLVHGSIQGAGGPRIGHAWVITPEGHVWEPATGQELEAGLFRLLFSAEEDAMYDWEAVLRMTLRTRNWGPWKEKEDE